MGKKEKIEKYIVKFACSSCGNIYDSPEEACACFEQDTLNIPMFIEERLNTIGEVFPVEIILKRIEGNFITEVASYSIKEKKKVNIKIE